MTAASHNSNTIVSASRSHKSKAVPTTAVSIQTDAIMVPFPLPPIGPSKGSGSSISAQTEYSWMFNEFPTKCKHESTGILTLVSSQGAEFPNNQSQKEPEMSEPVQKEAKVPDQTQREPEVPQPAVAITRLLDAVLPTVAPKTPKRSPPKKAAVMVTPEAAPIETPRFVRPVLSDSSDEEATQLLHKPVLARTITPVTVRPFVPVETPISVKAASAVIKNPEAWSSDSEDKKSSSSESNAEIPAIKTRAPRKRKQRTPKEPKPVDSSVLSQ